jgi:hypothetical protein
MCSHGATRPDPGCSTRRTKLLRAEEITAVLRDDTTRLLDGELEHERVARVGQERPSEIEDGVRCADTTDAVLEASYD